MLKAHALRKGIKKGRWWRTEDDENAKGNIKKKRGEGVNVIGD